MNKINSLPPRQWGVYADLDNIQGARIIETNGLRDVIHVEQLVGQPVHSVMWYPTWQPDCPEKAFPLQAVQQVKAHGATPHLVWEMCQPNEAPIDSSIRINDVCKGAFDASIDTFAQDAAAWGQPLFLRPMHEFNGTWYSWCGYKNNHQTDLYIQCWRHLVDRFRACGANNVRWVWSPNSIGGGTPDADGWNHIQHYWPGADYVDWFGLDGYNFYPEFDGPQSLLSLEHIFSELYAQCEALAPEKPMMLAEFASGEYSALNQALPSKAAWLEDAFATLTSKFEHIRYLMWFHVNKEKDWRIDSSPESLRAFRKGLSEWLQN